MAGLGGNKLHDPELMQISENVTGFYDANVTRKIRDFIKGNQRVERAWNTIDQWAPPDPRNILEVGCGIGHICWRMTRRWPEAHVVGLDISPKSVRIAQALFGSSRLSFLQGPLVKGKLTGKFDMIVLMDVYEHIPIGDRSVLHEALAGLLNDGCRIVLSFPTPRHLAWLRHYQPNEIQPVDEDISIDTISALARDTGTEVLLYQEVGVWHEGDYVHAVLGKREGWPTVTKNHSLSVGIRRRIRKLVLDRVKPVVPPRSQRHALVRQRLGPELYPD